MIERNAVGYRSVLSLSDKNWFIVQSNYDQEDKDSFHDPRRIGVENRLRNYGNVGFHETDLF